MRVFTNNKWGTAVDTVDIKITDCFASVFLSYLFTVWCCMVTASILSIYGYEYKCWSVDVEHTHTTAMSWFIDMREAAICRFLQRQQEVYLTEHKLRFGPVLWPTTSNHAVAGNPPALWHRAFALTPGFVLEGTIVLGCWTRILVWVLPKSLTKSYNALLT